jgi:predicted dienelactone hydrolase
MSAGIRDDPRRSATIRDDPRREDSQMPSSTFRYPSSDGVQITAYRWDPADEPRAVIQLTHGMGEHAQRYDYVARALNDTGFTVLRRAAVPA